MEALGFPRRFAYPKHLQFVHPFQVEEVVNLPGPSSSFTPHRHPRPEIYFYKFLPENGYGFCEMEDKVLKVKHNDMVKFLNGVSHPQVAAPGNVMWYLWVIKH